MQTIKQCVLALVFHAVYINWSKSFYCNYSFSSAIKKRLVSFTNTAMFDVHISYGSVCGCISACTYLI